MKKILGFFFNGLLIIVPVGITVLIVARIISWIEQGVSKLGGIVNPLIDPWITIAVALGIIIIVGVLGSTFLFKTVFKFFDHLMEKTPVIKTVYGSIKDILGAFVGSKRKFNKPVLVYVSPDRSLQQVGFITNEDLKDLGLGSDKVAVYFPTSYSFAGKVLIVPRENITPLKAPPGEVMKFVLTGGITDVD